MSLLFQMRATAELYPKLFWSNMFSILALHYMGRVSGQFLASAQVYWPHFGNWKSVKCPVEMLKTHIDYVLTIWFTSQEMFAIYFLKLEFKICLLCI